MLDFLLFQIFPEKKKWHEASEVCNRHGGSLVSIPDEDTRDAIAQINLYVFVSEVMYR